MNDAADRVAVSSVAAHSPTVQSVGAVWVVSNPGRPSQSVERITPSVAIQGLFFGMSMSFDAVGDRLAVGAPRMNSAQPGWVFVYHFDGSSWSEEWRFNSTYLMDAFGWALAMNAAGDVLAVGSVRNHWSGLDGAIDIFRRDAGGWSQEATITTAQLPDSSGIGAVVALSRDGRYLATRSGSSSNSPVPSGAVYVLERVAPGSWVQVARLQEPVAYSSGGFGASLAFDAETKVLAAGNWQDSRFAYMQGAVSIFRRLGATWAYDAVVLPSSPVVGGYFGRAVALNTAGDRMLVGAPGAHLAGVKVGAVEEFEYAAGAWRSVAEQHSPEPQQGSIGFGSFVLGGGVTLGRWATGAHLSDTFGVDAGVVHFYEARCLTPSTYCTAQTNTLGCAARAGWQGAASLSSPIGFTLSASNVRNQQNGMLFYGVNGRAALPWHGGTLCVEPPLRRTPVVNSGGSPAPAADCTGVLSLDFNAWMAAAIDPALFPGQRVRAQFYSRDPGAPGNLNLTDGVEFYLEP
jgi:hypothetical protein